MVPAFGKIQFRLEQKGVKSEEKKRKKTAENASVFQPSDQQATVALRSLTTLVHVDERTLLAFLAFNITLLTGEL